MLTISNLHAEIQADGKSILKGLDLQVGPGQIHAMMGPNGSGKSTLAHILAGREGYTVSQGEILYKGQPLLPLSPEERSWAGLFLAFQYPLEIPGVSNINFLKSSVNAHRKSRGEAPVDAASFLRSVKSKSQMLGLEDDFLYRSLNEGFSGGEKKRNEMLQMLVLEPNLVILDETDSGLDIDALKMVGECVMRLRDPNRSFIVITHYQRLLDYIVPDEVHVLHGGRIVKSGDQSLALELEKHGYGWITG